MSSEILSILVLHSVRGTVPVAEIDVVNGVAPGAVPAVLRKGKATAEGRLAVVRWDWRNGNRWREGLSTGNGLGMNSVTDSVSMAMGSPAVLIRGIGVE